MERTERKIMKWKKIIVTVLIVIMAVEVVGCKAGKQGGTVDTSRYSDRDIKLTLNYFDGGYGRDWVYAVVEDYMENVNKDVYVEVVFSYDSANALTELQSGVAADDIYMIETGVYDMGAYLAELSDVWESKAYGEETLIKDKVKADVYEFVNEDGKYYQFPYAKELGYSWAYNLTTLNEVLGEGNYVLPRTTDEFFALGDALAVKNTNLIVCPLADTQGGNYTARAYDCWFAQMVGAEGWQNYYNGLYKNAKGELVLAEDPTAFLNYYKDAIESAYAVKYKMNTKENHYVYSDSESLNFKAADQVFFGGGYGIKKTKVAAIFTGPWLESEVEDLLEDGIIQEQEVVSSKMPVISAITKRCETISDDQTLAAVVDYVDGVTAEVPAGVSEADVETVKEARNLVVDARCRGIVIPSCSDRIEEAKDLLRYFASDRAQKISAEHAGGVNQLPFGYMASEEDGIEMSDNVKSIIEKSKEAVVIDITHYEKKFYKATSIAWCAGGKYGVDEVSIFAGRGLDPAEVFETMVNKYDTDKWPIYLDTYYKLIGK